MKAGFAIPGDLATPTGGYVYDRRVIAASGGALTHLPLSGRFPAAAGADLIAAGKTLRDASPPVLIDGLAYGSLPADLIAALPYRPVALCHHPLALETGISAAEAARLKATERAALARAAHVVVTSAATGRRLTAEFGVAADRITVVAPGLDRTPPSKRAAGGAAGGRPVILTVASLTPRKGHDVLIDALARLAARDWTAIWAGSSDLAPAWAEKIGDRIAAAGLTDRIERRPPMDAAALDALYHGADIFCLPSRYEGYGMVFAEAMMRSLPVVACAADAVAEVVPRGAGALAPVDDSAALADALGALLDDAEARREAGAAGRAHALTLPSWDDAWAAIRDILAKAG